MNRDALVTRAFCVEFRQEGTLVWVRLASCPTEESVATEIADATDAYRDHGMRGRIRVLRYGKTVNVYDI